jgi:4-hydroxy-tetrahydrodipicolinate synthase
MKFSGSFGSVITAMVTPFDEELEIDYAGLKSLIEHLEANGTTALLITGTTGENPTLSHDEEWALLAKVRELSRLPVIFGAGSNSTRTAQHTSRRAQEMGADAIMSVVPYYNKPNQVGIRDHFSAIADCVDLPILLYNNPGRTCAYMEPETIAELHRRYPHVCALKESKSPQALDTITELVSRDLSLDIYAGDDALTLPAMALGACGVVSVASHVVGAQLGEMIEQFQAGNISTARHIHGRLAPLFRLLFAAPSPGPVKHLLASRGVCGSSLRPPLTKPEVEIREALAEIG